MWRNVQQVPKSQTQILNPSTHSVTRPGPPAPVAPPCRFLRSVGDSAQSRTELSAAPEANNVPSGDSARLRTCRAHEAGAFEILRSEDLKTSALQKVKRDFVLKLTLFNYFLLQGTWPFRQVSLGTP